ncbi:alpha-glucosidase/alpha-galactosidase [Victivallis sp. Marseille-Q1083]|uniref:family 4 glycosyl hydrolase n=1 Tax=Victivallis sp. Marseille-Q1083 TaxID=2717288 RepID=UPI00158F34D5|nr:alpha-glucosidase/alpha-galactosidase [Victivallis sp. Marseille-Q1083]
MSEQTQSHAFHTKKAEQLGITSSVSRPLKIVFMGAGSGFFQPLLTDVMNIPGAETGEVGIVDINAERLALAEQLGNKILKAMGKTGWKLTATTNRLEVLPGADYVINCIEVSGTSCVRFDNDIPAEYGVHQCIGDTIGPGGLFKALRTVPVFLALLKDVEKYCPDAWVLNYTNPMSILCLAAARYSKAKVIGLCHSVQGSSHTLATYLDIPYPELQWRCAGINHLAWFVELSHKGRDLYPLLKEKARTDAEFLAQDPIRLDMMLYFDHFVTESSGHFSEYLPYYRKRPELIAKHCGKGYLGESSFYADNWPTWRQDCDQRRRAWVDGEKELDLDRSWEYASFIIEAMETNNPFKIHGTVINHGLIPNLPWNNVVEVPCFVNRNGINPTRFDDLPDHCAAVCASNLRMFDLAANACIERSKDLAMKALLLDPLTAAVCAPSEIKEMTYRLFDAEKDFLPDYK